jgi:large subunit ribosomal protein L25
MANEFRLRAAPRTIIGKQVRQLRAEGLTPIVVYGGATDSVALQTETRELVRVLHAAGGTQIIELHVDGEAKPRMTLAKAVQRHVTKLHPLHVDFHQVAMDVAMVSDVPLEIVGEAPALRDASAMLAVELDRVSVRALPADFPTSILVDTSALAEAGDAIHVSDLPTDGKYEIVTEPGQLVARVTHSAMAAEEEEEPAAEELEELAGEQEEEPAAEAESAGAPEED